MKFVVGQMGHDGLKPDKEGSPRDYIKKAQAAVPEMPEFKGNAVCVKTDKFWDLDAHAIYTGPGGWSKDVEKWRQFGNDRGYHYYGSPWTFAQIGTRVRRSHARATKIAAPSRAPCGEYDHAIRLRRKVVQPHAPYCRSGYRRWLRSGPYRAAVCENRRNGA